MKMSKESYSRILGSFKENQEKIEEYAPKLKESVQYKDFDTRLTWDCLRAFVGTQEICSLYDNEDLNDDHITTAGKKALKEMKII